MNTWFSINLGNGLNALKPTQKIRKTIETALLLGAETPQNVSVFSKYDLRRQIITVYFTPGAIEYAKLFGAKPCKKPLSKDIDLLVGSWSHWFPDKNANLV